MDKNTCNNCGQPILIAIFKGSGHCSDDCRKVLSGEIKAKEPNGNSRT